MAISEKAKLNGDSVLVALSDGANTIEWDIAGDTAVLLTISDPTKVTFESQKINYQGEKKDGKYEARALTVVWNEGEEKQIQEWEKARTALTYTVTNYYTDAVTYTDCRVRLTDPAHVVPKQENYATMGIEVSCLADPYEDDAQ